MGVVQSTVSSWEAGQVRPNLEMLDQLTEFLDIDPLDRSQVSDAWRDGVTIHATRTRA